MASSVTGPRQPAVFLDRDGVINENRSDYVKSWEEFVFLPRSMAALRALAAGGAPTIVISNQAAIGRGLVARATVDAIHRRMGEAISAEGGRIDAVYYCPHHPAEGCDCRKPRPGLLLQAAAAYQIDLQRSYFIGDSIGDVEAALAVGCSPILALTGLGAAQLALLPQRGHYGVPVVEDLAAAVALIEIRRSAGLADGPARRQGSARPKRA